MLGKGHNQTFGNDKKNIFHLNVAKENCNKPFGPIPKKTNGKCDEDKTGLQILSIMGVKGLSHRPEKQGFKYVDGLEHKPRLFLIVIVTVMKNSL